MTERTNTILRPWALGLALCIAALGAALGGCAREDYYCDSTGCYYCDGVGCRPATPPTRPVCRGDYECSTGQICTNLGCTTSCRSNTDCPRGWTCRGGSGSDAGASSGVCVAPTEMQPVPNPGSCRTNTDCASGTVCIDGTCRMSPSPSCTNDTGCSDGQICVAGRCTARTDTCQFNNQCGANRVCVNSECRPVCTATSCPAGQRCVAAGPLMYCAPNTMAPTCGRDAECGAGQRCLNGSCYAACGAGMTCSSPELYCSNDGACVPDTRPRPFCDATHPCQPGSDCVRGVCRVPCATSTQCQMVDVTYRNCGQIPNQSTITRTYCLTDSEFRPVCSRPSECAMGQSCIDGSCL